MNLPIQVAGIIRAPWAWPSSAAALGSFGKAIVPQSTACHCPAPCGGSAENCGSAGCYCNSAGACTCKVTE